MLLKYIEEALRKARYEIIEDEEPYYGEIPELQRVWATGGTLQECRENLREVLEECISLSQISKVRCLCGLTTEG